MRHIVAGFAAAAIFAVVPTLVVAGNQEIADQIVRRLRDGGQMSDYSISVTYKDGTARLHGRVASEEQLATALKVGVPDARRGQRGQRTGGYPKWDRSKQRFGYRTSSPVRQ